MVQLAHPVVVNDARAYLRTVRHVEIWTWVTSAMTVAQLPVLFLAPLASPWTVSVAFIAQYASFRLVDRRRYLAELRLGLSHYKYGLHPPLDGRSRDHWAVAVVAAAAPGATKNSSRLSRTRP